MIIICHNAPLILATSTAANFPAVPRTVLESAYASCVMDSYEIVPEFCVHHILIKSLHKKQPTFTSCHVNVFHLLVDCMVYGCFPESHFPGKTFPRKTIPRKMFPRKVTFPEWTFPGKTFPGMALSRNGHIEHAHFLKMSRNCLYVKILLRNVTFGKCP